MRGMETGGQGWCGRASKRNPVPFMFQKQLNGVGSDGDR